jgi:hypothetical protein
VKDEEENILNGNLGPMEVEGELPLKGEGQKQPIRRDIASKLCSSTPPLTSDSVRKKIQQQKELIQYMQNNNDLPVDWPFCTFTGSGNNNTLHDLQPFTHVSTGGDCYEVASWAIRFDYNNEVKDSPIALLCTKHFTQLPPKPDGSFYRVFTLTIRNYKEFLK